MADTLQERRRGETLLERGGGGGVGVGGHGKRARVGVGESAARISRVGRGRRLGVDDDVPHVLPGYM